MGVDPPCTLDDIEVRSHQTDAIVFCHNCKWSDDAESVWDESTRTSAYLRWPQVVQIVEQHVRGGRG